MKNLNLLNFKWLWTDSHEKRSPQRFGRYAVMLIMLLSLGMGQMWAGDTYKVTFKKDMGDGDYNTGTTYYTMTQCSDNSDIYYYSADLEEGDYGFFLQKNSSNYYKANATATDYNKVELYDYGSSNYGNSSHRVTYSAASAGTYVFTYDAKNKKVYVSPASSQTVEMYYDVASGHESWWDLTNHVTLTEIGSTGEYYTDLDLTGTYQYYMYIRIPADGKYFKGTSTLTVGGAVTLYLYDDNNVDKVNFTPSTTGRYRFTWKHSNKTIKLQRLYEITPVAKYTNDGSTYTESTTGGTVTINGNSSATQVIKDATYEIVATPASGYCVEEIKVGDAVAWSQPNDDSRQTAAKTISTYTATADKTVTVKFAKLQNITLYIHDGGVGGLVLQNYQAKVGEHNVLSSNTTLTAANNGWYYHTFANVTNVSLLNVACANIEPASSANGGQPIGSYLLTQTAYFSAIEAQNTAHSSICDLISVNYSNQEYVKDAAPITLSPTYKLGYSASATYAWTVTSQPVGGAYTLSATNVATPTFSSSVPGTYTLQVQVTSDGCTKSTSFDIEVSGSSSPEITAATFVTNPILSNAHLQISVTYANIPAEGCYIRLKHGDGYWNDENNSAWTALSSGSGSMTFTTNNTNVPTGTWTIELYNNAKNSLLSSTNVTGSLSVLTAQTITINAGANGSVSPTIVYAGSGYRSESFTATPNDHYHFVNWSNNNSSNVTVNDVNSATTYVSTASAAATITANFAGDQYTITYKDQGDVAYSGNNEGSLPATHTYGTATALVNGTKNGYNFVGWYTDASCTVSAGSSIGATAKTSDFTLYAKWTEVMTTVTINVNPASAGTLMLDGNAFTPGNTTTAGVTTSHTVVATAKSGNVFLNWSTSGNATGSSVTNTYTLHGNGNGTTGTLTANFGVSTGWSLEGTDFGGWGGDNCSSLPTSYPFAYPYRDQANTYYIPVTLNSGSYFKVHKGDGCSNVYNFGTNSRNVAVSKNTVYSLVVDATHSGTVSTTMSNVWAVLNTSTNKFWVQDSKTYYTITLANGSSGDTGNGVAGTEGTVTLTTNDLGNLQTKQFASGERVNISVSAQSGYYIDDITIGGNSVATDVNAASYSDYTTMPASNTTLTVTYKRIYTVTYGVGTSYTSMGDVSTTPSISSGDYVIEGTSITFTATPNPGYKFVGWYREAACTNQISTDNPYAFSVTAAKTVYAKFELMDIKINSDVDGVYPTPWSQQIMSHSSGSPAIYTYSTTLTTRVTEQVSAPFNSGYHFNFLASNNELLYDYNGVQTPTYSGSSIDGIRKTADENSTIQFGLTRKSDVTITLTLQTPPTKPTVNIAADPYYDIAYTAPSHGSYTIQVGDAAAVNANTDARAATTITLANTPDDGYHFGSWTIAKSAGNVEVSNNQFTMPAENVTVSAAFTANAYSVRFNGNGNTGGSMDNQDFTYDAAQNLTANAFTKTGYTFAGWATSAGGAVVYNNSQSVSNLTATRGGIFDLYAKWTPNGYTVTLNIEEANHGTIVGKATSASVTFDAAPTAIAADQLPTAAQGYAFMGFFTAEDGEGRQFINPSGEWVTSAGDTISEGKWVKPDGITLYAYYKKAEITTLALSAGTVLPEGSVTATATIEPTPTGDTHIDWKLLYSNGSVHSSQPSEFSSTERSVEFTVPEASGSYQVQAQLRKGTTANAGDLLSERTTSFIVAGTHNVTIQYKCDGVNVKAATVVEGVKPLEWSEEITPGDEPFGYTFARWEAGDGVTIKDGSGEDKTTSTSSTIKIKAIYDGRLTAVYTKKNIVYFKNTFGWTNVYYHDSYWDNSKGGAGNKGQSHINQAMSLVPGTTNIYYWEGTPSGTDVAFTDHTYYNEGESAGYQAFWSKTFDAKVVYPSNPTCASSGDSNYGYNAGTPMFVPVEQEGQNYNEKDGGKAVYYNKGYWRAYDPTAGESGSTGYTLKIYNQTEGNSSRKLLQSIPFTNADASGQIFKATAGLNAAVGYGIKVERDNSLMYTNTSGHLNRTGDVETLSVNPDNYAAIWIKSTAAGDYDFIITCDGSGQLCLQATFPAAENDYRVLYTDNATWSNSAHTARTWVHPSRVISAEVGATDTISFFVSKGNSPEYKIQKVNSIDEGTGAITWTDVTSWTSISVDKTGVYNFIFNQPSAGSISLSKTEAYTGNYYIRTDNAGSTKWENYRAEDHKMTYSEYAAKITHTGEEWKDFTHYFMKYVDKDKESGKYKNVNFTVANDYSPCISDTLVQQAGDVSVTPSYTHVDGNGDLQASANIRFMWNIKNNKLQRAYLAAAQSDGTKFLVLQGESGKLLAPDGTALSDENGNNHDGGADAIQFTDKEHWMYEAEVKAVPGGRVKLYATYNSSTFYYYGDNDASFEDEHAIDLVTGNGGEAQTIRVVYDFKTDRLIAAWVPSDGDISAPQTINADIMLIREHQNAGKQINLKGTGSISTNKTVYGVMRFNRWTLNNKTTAAGHAVLPVDEQKSQYERFNYMISFPFDVKVGEIFGFGTIGRHYRIYYYDGLGRAKEGFFAERGDDNWRMIDDTDSILHANQGYLLQLNYIRMADDNTTTWPQASMNEVELYFPAMNEINTIKLEDVEIPALGDAYKCQINLQPTYHALNNPDSVEADRRVKDSYWRCIGVPGFTSYEATAGTWANFNWNAETDSLPYLYEWQMDDNKLSVVSSSTFTFKPMHAYLIQNGKSFTWERVAQPTVAAPRRSAAEEGFYEFYLEMQNGEQALDHTYVRLTDKENITADFDFGQDLSKELNSGANIFTKVGYERLAANNLPMSEQTTIVPVGVKIAAEGNYTFAMPEGTHGIGVTLVDNETGDRTNLSLFDYSINLTKGDYANRFILEISPVKQVPTDIENVQGDNVQGAKARKVMVDGILYIVKDGKVFDAQGKRLQ